MKNQNAKDILILYGEMRFLELDTDTFKISILSFHFCNEKMALSVPQLEHIKYVQRITTNKSEFMLEKISWIRKFKEKHK